ncbi:protein of unknown function [Methylorubrum extorquens DM4]|uniref:Uncharacterized protein n=1 Tax=Methylorubrum extorquens (strain DSM 6343 / CIP 106787 / DM4) TaxID=661410 RepID=C7C6H2_METED|nr:hypothetical protein [Methylorubrum extorquens]CAX21696.1 protein of unknown function [Methylorubrum extorquens DM4]
MPETIEPRKGATGQPIAQPSPVEMLKQAVAGGPKAAAKATPPAAAPTRKAFHLGANGRLAAASVTALVGGVCLGLVAAPQERSGAALAQVQAELSAGRSEAARFAQEIDRLARTVTALRDASEAARGENKALGHTLTDRLSRTEQTLDKRLANFTETVARVERDQTERMTSAIAQWEKKLQPVAAAPAKAESKLETRAAEPTQTGSLPDKPKSDTLEGWALRDVYDGVAVLEDRRRRLVEVGRGDAVPGIGRVEAIERRGRQWVVVTRQGVITPQAW